MSETTQETLVPIASGEELRSWLDGVTTAYVDKDAAGHATVLTMKTARMADAQEEKERRGEEKGTLGEQQIRLQGP
jgi:hypothetical protein